MISCYKHCGSLCKHCHISSFMGGSTNLALSRTTSKSKPPLPQKRCQLSQLFFPFYSMEYQEGTFFKDYLVLLSLSLKACSLCRLKVFSVFFKIVKKAAKKMPAFSTFFSLFTVWRVLGRDIF